MWDGVGGREADSIDSACNDEPWQRCIKAANLLSSGVGWRRSWFYEDNFCLSERDSTINSQHKEQQHAKVVICKNKGLGVLEFGQGLEKS